MSKTSVLIKLPIIIVFVVLLTGCAPVPVPGDSSHPEVQVFYSGADDAQHGVHTAIELMQASGLALFVEDPALADVIVINGYAADPEAITAYVKEGAGMVLLLGPDMTNPQLAALLDQEVTVTQAEEALSLVADKGSASPLLKDIVWGSAPQVRERSILAGLDSEPIILGYQVSEAVLSETTVGAGRVFIFTPAINDANTQFQEWPYFNYFLYDLITRAKGETPLTFGNYPASPVPHTREKVILVGLCTAVTLVALSIFFFVRRYSLKHPEILDELVASKENYNIREAGTAWEEVGFHRPLAGFMFAMMMGILLFIPLIIYQNMILPTFILPSAQAFGLIGRVGQIFTLAWTLFDVGTSIAFVKFYSQYRVHDPRRAIQFGQLFVWWQALSGAFQVALVVILAGTFVPKTSYAIYTWIIVIHAVIQIPGFFRVMRDAMYAQQRLDYAQILDNFIMLVWPMVTQPIFVLLMLWWSRGAPMVGGALGGAIGLAIAAYAVELCNFTLGLWLYRRIGYNSRILFLAHFDGSVIKQAFSFGALDMSGSVILAAASAVEIFITQTRLINYAEVWGNWMMANNFMLAFDVLRNLVDGVMPAISEAISHARRKLSQYYVTMSYKWDAMIGGFVASVLLAIADRFIIGSSGPEFTRAAIYVLPLIAFGSVQHLNMIVDAVALASNRPGMKMAMIAAEQTLRLALAFLLLERFQVTGLIIAYLVATLTRGIAIYFINSKVCFPLRYYPWQSLVVPVASGTVHYVILRFITGLIWQGEPITSIIIFLVGILFSYPFYTFFYGLFGGWDDATLDELKQSVDMQPFLKFMAVIFYKTTLWGARLSPLHNRFPITIRDAAMVEAASLTAERVNLTDPVE